MRKTSKLIVVSGGARSGKSTFAENLAGKMDKQVAYLATAQALDEEMTARIAKHRRNRPAQWRTFEEPLNICQVIKEHATCYHTWLMDCLTLYISNLLYSSVKDGKAGEINGDNFIYDEQQAQIMGEIEHLIETVRETSVNMVLVTNEVGWGLVPPDPLSRAYRDIVGKANQRLAAAAHEVYLVALGIPLKLKPAGENMTGEWLK